MLGSGTTVFLCLNEGENNIEISDDVVAVIKRIQRSSCVALPRILNHNKKETQIKFSGTHVHAL